jgi:hypothetical protein
MDKKVLWQWMHSPSNFVHSFKDCGANLCKTKKKSLNVDCSQMDYQTEDNDIFFALRQLKTSIRNFRERKSETAFLQKK